MCNPVKSNTGPSASASPSLTSSMDVLDLTLEISGMNVVFERHSQFHHNKAKKSLTLPQHENDTDAHDSDDETASTITAESTTTSSSHRSIFGDYWQKNGGEASRVSLVPVSALPIPPPCFEEHEPLLECKNKNKAMTPASPRRSIFGASRTSSSLLPTSDSSSSPSAYLAQLAAQYQPDPLQRKVQSDSLLVARPPSLLRRGRFSSASDTTSTTTSLLTTSPSQQQLQRLRRSVTFDERVHVVEFSKPLERYAMQGWDKHFAV